MRALCANAKHWLLARIGFCRLCPESIDREDERVYRSIRVIQYDFHGAGFLVGWKKAPGWALLSEW